MIGSLELEICTNMLGDVIEKLTAKFPVTTFSYSMVKIKVAVLQIFEGEVSPVAGRSLQQKDKIYRKRKAVKKKKKTEKP